MAYNTKTMLRDNQGQLIPQYYDKEKDQYLPYPDPSKLELIRTMSDFRNESVTVTDTQVELTAGLPNKKQLIIYPPSAGTIYWGTSGVTTVNGVPLSVGDLPVEFSFADSSLKVYAVSDGTNRSVKLVESK